MDFRRTRIALRTIRRSLAAAIDRAFGRRQDDDATRPPFGAERTLGSFRRYRNAAIAIALVGGAGTLLWKHPPMQAVGRGDVGVRTNQLTGSAVQWQDGSIFVFPGLHQVRVLALRDQVYRPGKGGIAALQSVEGLSLGVDIAVRYALDPSRVLAAARDMPDDVAGGVVEPAVQGVIYKVFARYTVREIFSSKRAEIQQAIEGELKPRLAADGLLLKAVQIGQVELPPDYKRGMEGLLAEELASEKMRYTLELKDKRVSETELDAKADKARREIAAEAAAREQVIAARGQEEAMKHVLPFKQRQIEQRQLEAEADKQSRIRVSEGAAQARRIEAAGEADARQKLAEAEAWRLERVGKANAEQMGREGALVARYPLLIQKTLADKLSDKIQVIIAPPPADGGFIGTALLGGNKHAGAAATQTQAAKEED
ncbi:SPFH domain-containing protein [Caenimonas terrae]|uniref:SPFH domain-containing protein n=1 Tax=Caenimonas terrae TaxID=696074 RepID=A0ABW0NJ25_9BURK